MPTVADPQVTRSMVRSTVTVAGSGMRPNLAHTREVHGGVPGRIVSGPTMRAREARMMAPVVTDRPESSTKPVTTGRSVGIRFAAGVALRSYDA